MKRKTTGLKNSAAGFGAGISGAGTFCEPAGPAATQAGGMRDGETGAEGGSADEGVLGLRPAVRVAEEVGEGVGRGAVLLGPVPHRPEAVARARHPVGAGRSCRDHVSRLPTAAA
jgi:hypothetical protein